MVYFLSENDLICTSIFKCFELSKVLLQENVLFEAEKTCDFICQLSSYLPQWRVSSPESVHQLQVIPRPLGQFLLNSMDTDGCIDNA